MDGRRFISSVFSSQPPLSITQVVTNLPNDAVEFLAAAFRGAFKRARRLSGFVFPKIHVYGFSKWNNPKFDFNEDRLEQEEQLKAKEAELLRGNPLINNGASFNVKRRWDDDVVFKNQTRGESKAPKRFINDTIRNDFHRKFLHKYMK